VSDGDVLVKKHNVMIISRNGHELFTGVKKKVSICKKGRNTGKTLNEKCIENRKKDRARATWKLKVPGQRQVFIQRPSCFVSYLKEAPRREACH
jgi:hypothetical protein